MLIPKIKANESSDKCVATVVLKDKKNNLFKYYQLNELEELYLAIVIMNI